MITADIRILIFCDNHLLLTEPADYSHLHRLLIINGVCDLTSNQVVGKVPKRHRLEAADAQDAAVTVIYLVKRRVFIERNLTQVVVFDQPCRSPAPGSNRINRMETPLRPRHPSKDFGQDPRSRGGAAYVKDPAGALLVLGCIACGKARHYDSSGFANDFAEDFDDLRGGGQDRAHLVVGAVNKYDVPDADAQGAEALPECVLFYRIEPITKSQHPRAALTK